MPLYLAFGAAIGLLAESGTSLDARLLIGLAYGVMVYLTNGLHSLGHIISARLVGAPMDENLVTATFYVTLYYGDQTRHSRWVHIGRSLGGPLANLLTGLVALGLWQLADAGWLAFFALGNLLLGIYLLLPIPSIDGWVIWSELLRRGD